MLLIAHITVAVVSLILATHGLFAPSSAKLRASYVLVAATLASGAYLAWANPGHLASVCTTGLAYIGMVSAAILAARSKLARS